MAAPLYQRSFQRIEFSCLFIFIDLKTWTDKLLPVI